MIITGSRIATSSGAGAVGSHVLSGPANEAIDVLQGCQADLDDMVRDAQEHGSKYALRHWKVSPKEGMGTEDARAVAADLAREFGADPARLMIVEHQKPRAGGAGHDRHWHVIAPEYDPVRGRVLNAHWMRPRHEKLARIAEARLGHDLVPGRWNAAVGRALADEGRPELARRLDVAAALPRPESGYTATQHQVAARRGRAMPDDRMAVAAAWKQADGPQAFAAALREQGISLRAGDKPGTWIAERDGALVGAVHRLVGERKAAVGERLAGAGFLPPAQPGPAAPAADNGQAAQPRAGAAAPVPGQLPAPDTAPETRAAAGTGEQPAASAGSRDGTGSMTKPAPSGGGGGSAPAAAEAGGQSSGGLGTEATDGPGEPPGSGASVQEVQRWRERFLAYEERKGRAWLAQQAAIAAENDRNTKKGGGHGPVQQQADPVHGQGSGPGPLGLLAGIRRAAVASSEAEAGRIRAAAGVVPAPGLAAGHGHDRAAGRGPAAHDRHDSPDARPGGPGRVDAARPGGPEGGRGTPADGGPGAGRGDDRGGPAAPGGEGRPYLEAAAATARLARGLASVPEPVMGRLRRAAAALRPGAAAAARVQADRERIARVLAGHPHPDPDDRSGEAREAAEERAARREHTARTAAEAAATAAAARAAFHDRGPLTWLCNVCGGLTSEQERLVALAELAEADVGTRPHDGTLRAARERGRLLAMGARDRTEAWERRPEVHEARERQRLNDLVAEAGADGDPAVSRALRHGDPEAARRVIQDREEAERRRREEQERRMGMQPGPGGLAAPDPRGPR